MSDGGAVTQATVDAVGSSLGSAPGHLHLPPWVSASEQDQISCQVQEWVDALSPGVRAAIVTAGEALPASKPLRPVWLCPASFPSAPSFAQLAATAQTGTRVGGAGVAGAWRGTHTDDAHGCRDGSSWEDVPPLLDGTQP